MKVGKMMGAQDTSRKTLRNASILRTPLHRIPLADTQKGTQNTHCRVVPLQKNRANEKLGRWKPIFLSPLLLAAILTATAAAEDVIEPFESAQVSWQLVEEDCSPRVIIHQRTTQQRHSGDLSEVIHFESGVGTLAYWSHPIPPARILPEFSPSVWIKSNRQGIRLYALVVFPRELSASGEGPVQRLIPGPSYDDRGDWQQLRFDSLPQDFSALYHRAVQAARLASSDGKFDDQDAYVSAIVLNTYGGPGSTHVWTDDLGLSGFVPSNADKPPHDEKVVQASWQIPDDWNSTGRTTIPYRSDSMIIADGRPTMLKIADHHGESLEYLQSLGFNTIRLVEAPTLAINQEAARLNLWLIAPPPNGYRAMAEDRAFTRVLAWNLGRDLDLRSQENIDEWVRSLRSSPATAGRMLHAEVRWTGLDLSRSLDLVQMQVTSELSSRTGRLPYDSLSSAMTLLPSGTPLVATLPLEASPKFVRQVAAMGGQVPDLGAAPQACKRAVFQAIAAGARGIAFKTSTRLDGTDPGAKRRSMLAAWLNDGLDQMEPWVAGGHPEGVLRTTRPDWTAATLSTDRSRMILLFKKPGVAAPPNPRELSIVDTRGSASSQFYRITASGPVPLVLHGTPGSVNVLVPERGTAEMLVSTQDPLILRHLNALARDDERIQRRLELQHDLLTYWVGKQSQVQGELEVYQAGSGEATALYQQALQTLSLSEQQLLRRDFSNAYQTLNNGQKELSRSRQILLANATGPFPAANTSPLCLDISSLPGHWDLALRLGEANWNGSVLAGGDFEDLSHLIESGWTHHRWGFDGDRIDVSLTREDVKSGQRALQIELKPIDPLGMASHAPAQVRVESGPIHLLPNQIARIHGWIKIESTDSKALRVWIEDTLGGTGLGRWLPTANQQWQEFTFYRGAFSEQADHLVFEIQGYGSVKIDHVTVHVAQPAGRAIGNQKAPEVRETLAPTSSLR